MAEVNRYREKFKDDWKENINPPILAITGFEWYDKEQTESVFILMLNPLPDAKGDMSGRKKSLLWEEWFAYKGWLRKQPTMWERYRQQRVDDLAAQAKAIGIVDRKVIGKNGCRKMIPTEIKGREVPVMEFGEVDTTKLEQNVELFEKLLEATAEMTPDEHCEAFKRLQQTIE